ncbi:MAG TPA: hypothetical protein PKC28_14220, partial [Bdellovibrionales bacterium]|nr:hypothetical protein [Bdellovibrionales bacterium]
GGGVTTSVGPTNTMSKWNVDTGEFEGIVIDYNHLAPGDSPIAIEDYDSEYMLVLVENTTRRIDLVRKDGKGFTTYLLNGTALNAAVRDIHLLPDYSLLVSKATAIEKFNSGLARVMVGANPYVSAPAAPCAASNTNVTSVTTHAATGKIVYTHGAASPNNRIGTISATGYAIAGDCNAGLAGPATTALPTRAIFHPNGKLFVSYGSTTAASNYVYSYDFNAANGAITGAAVAYSDNSVVNGPSTIAIDPVTQDMFIANVTSTFNTIERFSVSGGVLTSIPGPTFISYSLYTRCVSDMKVMD